MRPDPAEYYPTVVGTRHVYATTTGEVTCVVTAVDPLDRGVLVTTETREPDGTEVARAKVKVTARGLFLADRDGRDHDPPRCLLKLPPKAGDRWDVVLGGDGRAGLLATSTAGGVEEVEVPAGKFRAARVESECEGVRFVSWYAPKVGLVRTDVTGGTGLALQAFTPGRP
jgi:hypothetical protein